MYPTYDECMIFITRYDKNGDKCLTFTEFSDSFLAQDTYYSTMVNRRGSNYVPRVIKRDDVFMPHTAAEF